MDGNAKGRKSKEYEKQRGGKPRGGKAKGMTNKEKEKQRDGKT